jgi:hypothetical protein
MMQRELEHARLRQTAIWRDVLDGWGAGSAPPVVSPAEVYRDPSRAPTMAIDG